jgi:hypothetical protein
MEECVTGRAPQEYYLTAVMVIGSAMESDR